MNRDQRGGLVGIFACLASVAVGAFALGPGRTWAASSAVVDEAPDAGGEDLALPEKKVECDTEKTVYRNKTTDPKPVTIQVTDGCPGWSTKLHLIDGDGGVVDTEEIADGDTVAVDYAVPAGGSLEIECEGSLENEGDCCTYAIE